MTTIQTKINAMPQPQDTELVAQLTDADASVMIGGGGDLQCPVGFVRGPSGDCIPERYAIDDSNDGDPLQFRN